MNERKERLLETLKTFNKSQKNEILGFGSDAEDKEIIPTGIHALDNFIGGGTRRGTFTVIYGGQSVGKSTLVLQAIGDAQKNGKICCYIDLEHTFDKDRATSLGIDLNELILAEKCANAEQALEIIRTLCKQKVVDIIVVDSVQAMSPKNEQENKGKERELASKEIAELARTLSKFFRVVSPDVFNAQASVIMIGQVRIAGIGSFYTHAEMTGGEAIKHWAFTRCFMRKGQKVDAPVEKFKEYFCDPDGKIRFSTQKQAIGFDAVIKLQKTKSSSSATEGSEIHLPFIFKNGFVNEIEEPTELPVRIDITSTESQKKEIEEYLIEKKPEEAKQLGLIKVEEEKIEEEVVVEDKPNENVVAPEYDLVTEGGDSKDIIKEKKKKRGRPSKKDVK